MTTADGGSPVSKGATFRGLLSLRRNQVVAMEQGHEQELHALDHFQSHVADHLLALAAAATASKDPSGSFLTLSFVSKLLDALLSCEEEFRHLLGRGFSTPAALSKPPLDRLTADLLDRAIKSLDLCNAATLSLHSVRHWHRHALIAASALLPPNSHLGDGPLNRSRRALAKLLADSYAGGGGGGSGSGSGSSGGRGGGQGRATSWNGSGSSRWRLQHVVSSHLLTPRCMEAVAVAAAAGTGGSGAGMAIAVYTMSSLLAFAMWVLVAAVPCQQDRTTSAGPVGAPPRHLAWAAAMVSLQERVSEEWGRIDRKGAAPGLLAELQAVESCGRRLAEAVGESRSGGPWLAEEEVAERAAELAEACQMLDEGLGPLERHVREVFHRLVISRAEVLRRVEPVN